MSLGGVGQDPSLTQSKKPTKKQENRHQGRASTMRSLHQTHALHFLKVKKGKSKKKGKRIHKPNGTKKVSRVVLSHGGGIGWGMGSAPESRNSRIGQMAGGRQEGGSSHLTDAKRTTRILKKSL